MQEHLGLVGVGALGGPIGYNLLKAGYALTIHTRARTRPEAQRLLEHGATFAASAAEVGRTAHTVLTVVGDVEESRQVTTQLVESMTPGGLIIAMETIDPSTRRELAALARTKGLRLLDAPVSGTTSGAARGTLTIMVGGTPEDLARARPILEVVGSNIHHCGPVGTGSILKLSNNWIYLSSMVTVVQAARMAQRAHIDPTVAHIVWLQSAADCQTLRRRVPFAHVVSGNPFDAGYQPGYRLEYALKDLHLIRNAAEELQVPTHLMADVLALYERAVEQGLGALDIAALAEIIP